MASQESSNRECDDSCPVRATVEVFAHKWATLIVRDLLSGKKRFSELEASLYPVSPKVLSERLRELEQQRIVLRTVLPTVPPSTEYELTSLGREFEAVVVAMQRFGILLLERNKATLA